MAGIEDYIRQECIQWLLPGMSKFNTLNPDIKGEKV